MKRSTVLLLAAVGLAAGAVAVAGVGRGPGADENATPSHGFDDVPDTLEVAVFAGGCFWCVEEAFDEVEGVVSTTSGYTGGDVARPSYEQVSAGGTGHAEAVRVVYDPDVVTYAELLDVFWRNVDPTDAGGQFCDRGDQYRSGIFVRTAEQRRLAEASQQRVVRTKSFAAPIVTEIVDAGPFYAAETYHQDYHRKNPVRYKFYKFTCGRARRLAELWGEKG